MAYAVASYIPWVKDTAERAVKTFIQFFLVQLVAANFFSVSGLQDMSLIKQVAISAAGAGLSVISSAISTKFGVEGSASAVTPEVEVPVKVPEPAAPYDPELPDGEV